MKKEDLFSAIGGLDEETVGAASSRLQKKNNIGSVAGTVIASVLTLALLVPTVILVGLKFGQKPAVPSDDKGEDRSPQMLHGYLHAENVTYFSEPIGEFGEVGETGEDIAKKHVYVIDTYEQYLDFISKHPTSALAYVTEETFEKNNLFFVKFYEADSFDRCAEVKYFVMTAEVYPPIIEHWLLINFTDLTVANAAGISSAVPCTGVVSFTVPKDSQQSVYEEYYLTGSVVYFNGEAFLSGQLATSDYNWSPESSDPPVVPDVTDRDSALKAYSALIGEYTKAAIASSEGNLLDLNNDGDIDAADYGDISPLILYCKDPSEIGYTVKDINGDGICELLIGGMKGSADEKIVYALYTLKKIQYSDDEIGYEIVSVFVSSERDYYCWIEDHAFGHFGSSGADDSEETVFKFSPAGSLEYPDDLSAYQFAQLDLTPLAEITASQDTVSETTAGPDTEPVPYDIVLFPDDISGSVLSEAGIPVSVIWVLNDNGTYFGFCPGDTETEDRKNYFGYDFIFPTTTLLYSYSGKTGFEKGINAEKYLTKSVAEILCENMDTYFSYYYSRLNGTEPADETVPVPETTADSETEPVETEYDITGYLIDVHDNTSEAYNLLIAAELEYLIDYAEETNAAPILDALNGITGWTEVDPDAPYEEYEDKITFTGLFFSLDSDFSCFYCINPAEKLVTKYSSDGVPFISADPVAYARMETVPEIFAELVGMSENTRKILNEHF